MLTLYTRCLFANCFGPRTAKGQQLELLFSEMRLELLLESLSHRGDEGVGVTRIRGP